MHPLCLYNISIEAGQLRVIVSRNLYLGNEVEVENVNHWAIIVSVTLPYTLVALYQIDIYLCPILQVVGNYFDKSNYCYYY